MRYASSEWRLPTGETRMPKLVAYVMDGHHVHIRPAPLERDWMDQTNQRFAYRCLPLNIANAHGWELLTPSGFTARWNGAPEKTAVEVIPDRAGDAPPAVGHFGHGVLTFHVSCIFRTDPGVDLFVTGPINRPKDGIGALSGVVETDWSNYSFTMNWLFTRPYAEVHFDAGEPYAHLFPVQRGVLERVEPEIRALSEMPEMEHEYKAWSDSRNGFNADLEKPGSDAERARWQKSYFRGVTPLGEPAPATHQSRLRLAPFATKSPASPKG
jgi:hypothetical protein